MKIRRLILCELLHVCISEVPRRFEVPLLFMITAGECSHFVVPKDRGTDMNFLYIVGVHCR